MLENVVVNEFVCSLQKCRQRKDVECVRNAYVHICKKGLESYITVANYLISSYIECKSMLDAFYIFERFQGCRNERSWTSLMQGCIECGNPTHSLMLFHKNVQENWCIKPSKYTFVALLKACSKLKCITEGQTLHMEIILGGIEMDPFVGNTMIDMYAKCSMILEAHHVFHNLSSRNVISWNVLVTGFIEYGCEFDALNCIKQMEIEGISPDAITLSCGLKACTLLGDLDTGQQIHAQVVCKGVESSSQSLEVNLVEMYVKCGSFLEAKTIFEHAFHQNLIVWTVLISGYVESGLSEEALKYLEKIHECGISPDEAAFVCILKACSNLGSIEEGRCMHAKLVAIGMEKSIVLCNTLLDLYTKCGLLVDARHVFEAMQIRTVVTWNVLINGNAEHGHDKDALDCFYRMSHFGVFPDLTTFNCSLKACGNSGMINEGRRIHIRVLKEGLEVDQVLGNVLVDMYAKCGSLLEARKVFNKLPMQNLVSWNTIISSYVEHEHYVEALNCLEEMQSKDIHFDTTTSIFFLKICGSLESVQKGQKLHIEIVKKGLEKETFVANCLVDMYAKCGHFREAEELFGCTQVHNVVVWCTLLAAYVDRGHAEEALKCVDQMQAERASKNMVTYISILKACSMIGAIDMGRVMHSEIVKVGIYDNLLCGFEDEVFNSTKMFDLPIARLEASHIALENALIDMYGKCGSLTDAYNLVTMVCFVDIVSWNAIIAGYARQGQSESVFDLFVEIIEKGIRPNHITFLGALSACSHAGLVDVILYYFMAMESSHGFAPLISHFNCMLDAFARAGQFNEAVLMIQKMPHQPNLASWCSILGACCKWGNVELGRHAFECASKLTKSNASLFIVMANIYTDAHMWEQLHIIETALQSSMVLEHG